MSEEIVFGPIRDSIVGINENVKKINKAVNEWRWIINCLIVASIANSVCLIVLMIGVD